MSRLHAAVILLALAVASPKLQSAASRPLFVFQNNFWVNLHHVLRGDARRAPLKLPLTVDPDTLNPEERAAWIEASTAYAPLGAKDPVFDAQLISINNALTLLSDAAVPGALPASVRDALAAAAPVYRAHVWLRQQQANLTWLTEVEPIVQSHAASITSAIASAYHTTWPQQPVLVDVASEAGRTGAYTTEGPAGYAAHTTIASSGPELQGDMAVEIVFHEASHGIDAEIMKLIDGEAARQHIKAPPELWHAMLFFTAGEIVRRDLGQADNAAYKPYADRYDVYSRNWSRYRAALERYWQPYLRGTLSFDAALAGVVRDSAGADPNRR